MHRVDLVTDIAFWREARGDASRVRALAEFLAPRTSLRVIVLARSGQIDAPVVRTRLTVGATPVNFVGILHDTQSGALAHLQTVFREDPAKVALFEYVRLDWARDALPGGTRAFLDTHEINHERNERFAAAGLSPPSALTEVDEYAAFSRFDRVILIQREEGETVARRIGADRVLVAPHPVRILTTEVRDTAHRIGFVGSEYPPNVEGLRWFFGAVWPHVGRSGAVVDIYGGAGSRLNPAELPANARCHGKVADLDAAYRTLDIAINPVRIGAGLKIKTVEALGAGLPLVTTPEGARGILEAAGDAFLVASDERAFAAHLALLLASRELREELATAARRFAETHFGAEVCFGPLLRAIEESA